MAYFELFRSIFKLSSEHANNILSLHYQGSSLGGLITRCFWFL